MGAAAGLRTPRRPLAHRWLRGGGRAAGVGAYQPIRWISEFGAWRLGDTTMVEPRRGGQRSLFGLLGYRSAVLAGEQIDRWDDWSDLVERQGARALTEHLMRLSFCDPLIV